MLAPQPETAGATLMLRRDGKGGMHDDEMGGKEKQNGLGTVEKGGPGDMKSVRKSQICSHPRVW